MCYQTAEEKKSLNCCKQVREKKLYNLYWKCCPFVTPTDHHDEIQCDTSQLLSAMSNKSYRACAYHIDIQDNSYTKIDFLIHYMRVFVLGDVHFSHTILFFLTMGHQAIFVDFCFHIFVIAWAIITF